MFSFDPLDAGADADGFDGEGTVDVPDGEAGDGDVRDDAEAADDGDAADDGEVLIDCGDGVPNPGEECDDGNAVSGDGCESDCTWTCETDPDCDDANVCNGTETCAAHLCEAGTPATDGTACTQAGGDPGVCRSGSCASMQCGNGAVDRDEECDDGNTDDTDACLTTCRAASCGDGAVWSGREECDDGNVLADDGCEPDCTWGCEADGECDDGEPCTGLEACTDHLCAAGVPPAEGSDCTTGSGAAGVCRGGMCAVVGCGNGAVDPGEECDDGNASNADACLNSCRDAACGDGFVWSGREACEVGESRVCATSCGTAGDEDCDGACAWSGVCTPPAELCNGIDDDCDLACDNGFPCCAGTIGPCATSCGSSGSRACSAMCGPGACIPPAETCNGRDDDCDLVCDNGFGCCAGAAVACSTSCGTAGTRSCSAACAPTGSCCAPTDVCGNSCDDDCDTVVDDGCSGCPLCPGAVAVVLPGNRYTGTLTAGAGTTSGSCGGSGAEAVFAFTLTSAKDVFIATHGTAFDTVVYVRNCACDGPEVGCNDDAGGRNTSVLVLRDLPGGTYQVFLDGKTSAAGGAYSIDVYVTDPGPSGDRCGDPLPFSGSVDTVGNSCSFSADYLPAAGTCEYANSGGGEDVVYYFYLPTAATVRVQTCGSSTYCPTDLDSTCVDTAVYVREVCTRDTPQRACDDDACGYRSGRYNIHSDTGSIALPAGLYYLFLDGYNESTGTWMHCGDYVITTTGIP
jgi:cysteine-rich repeat protein